MKDLFRRRSGFPLPFGDRGQREQPDRLWILCPSCHEQLYAKEYVDNLRVCPKCRYHFKLSYSERLDLLLDPGSFEEHDREIRSSDPIHFHRDGVAYADKLPEYERQAGSPESVVYGTGAIEDLGVVVAVNNFAFQAGTMGVAAGEKIARATELAARRRLPLLIISASGGARQDEGVYALMQMAKTTAALSQLGRVGVPYLSILTDATTGGVLASYAMRGDVIIAEPGAFIGFAGPRVIEQTIKQKLPPGTASAESMLEHGMVDMVCPRADLRPTIARLLRLLGNPAYRPGLRGADPARAEPSLLRGEPSLAD